jgi:hypothetical protein
MNSDIIMEAPQDHHMAKKQVSPLNWPGYSSQSHYYLQALVWDGYKCMLTGKTDASYCIYLQGLVESAAIAKCDLDDAEAVAAALGSAPDSALTRRVHECADAFHKSHHDAQAANEILGKIHDPPITTQAAHIFSESVNKNLSDKSKVRLTSVD